MTFEQAKQKIKTLYWQYLVGDMSFKELLKIDNAIIERQWPFLQEVLDDLVEGINQFLAVDDEHDVSGSPYFLVDYYVLDSDVNQDLFTELRQEVHKIIETKEKNQIFNRFFDSYEEFREVLEAELAKENK